jgi:hypothetical protein
VNLGFALLRRASHGAGWGQYCLRASTAAALATLLTACGNHVDATIPTVNAATTTFSHQQTFKFTGKPQRFKVPHVQWLQVVVRGAAGAGTSNDVARGGRVYALIPASIDRELVVYVGGAGNLTKGGYNGGADGGADSNCSSCGYGGGGASDIRLAGGTLGGRVIVAGGAGGGGGGHSGEYSGGAGGAGGGGSGGAGSGSNYSYCAGKGGGGGSQGVGGSGGGGCGHASGNGGSVGDGGTGGASYYGGAGGGGGGGGFYGGGGGGGGATGYSSYYGSGGGGGGGGGASYVGKRAMHSRVWAGWKNAVGNGLVVISW